MKMEKIIYDPVHGPMKFSSTILSGIDTIEFQRLRYIKQLGCCYLVFPSATHTRFEHSLGVCHLAGEMMRGLQYRQPELKITNRLIELVQLAGLFHDIGHGPFSHLFEDKVIPSMKEGFWKMSEFHEERSQQIVEKIAPKLKLSNEELKLIKALIHPSDNDIKEYKWLTQIVADPISGVDVDKFDYVARDSLHLGIPACFLTSRIILEARVIDNILSYPEKNINELDMLYVTRFRLHKQVYQHRVTIALEYEISEILSELVKLRPKWFNNWRNLTDYIIERILYDDNEDLNHLKDKIKQIEERKLYNCIYNDTDKPDNELIKDNKIIKLCYGYKKHPLETLWWYNRKEPNKRYNLDISKIPKTDYCEKYLIFEKLNQNQD